ncbi:GntR family transcriptional regulator [Nocardioides zeae]|uniref:GntR family transcriptional regulator n=1 Tax=Nocardioides imazamoxiresistens TaxID=3231893 RepID=A0ABU3PUB2_9ACTN|nr:GntR family transcriptional regulator [Nocardioides zeae]MDT9592817.1 GntR family transcriptional regulator [Nocardioides zeae]
MTHEGAGRHDERVVGDNAQVPDPYAALHVEVTSTVDRVADELRRAVFDGDLESGTPLRELALAASLGVARSTVREALGVLVGEGIATREPNRGVTVATPDVASVRDVCRARAVLEVAGVRRWAAATDDERSEVRAAVGAYTDAVRRGATYAELNETHLAVHVSLVGLAGSPRLVHMARSLVAELKLVLAQIDRAERNAHDQADTHGALVALLDAGRVEEAAHEIEHHLAAAEQDILRALGVA